MTMDQFNNEFPNSKIDSSFDWTEPLKSLTVAKNVILNVGVRFIDGKLASISTESTKQLLDLLKLQNGIARNEDHGKLKVTIFNSKSENIMIVKENEFIGFIDKSLMRKLHE